MRDYLKIGKTSDILISIVTIFLLINSSLAYILYSNHNKLIAEVELINHAGIVRGSIQRLSKLSLSECNNNCKRIQLATDKTIQKISYVMQEEGMQSRYDSNYLEELSLLINEWNNLKGLILAYSEKPSAVLYQNIIASSEQCWQIANTTVLLAQLSVQNKIASTSFTYFLIMALNLLNAFIVITLLITNVRNKLEHDVVHDPLTGVFNRNAYENFLFQEIQRGNRYNRVFSLLLFDIDDLKVINDTRGHKVGDNLICNITDMVKSSLRKSDEIFRIGGDEFAVILPETDRYHAKQLSLKILNDLNSLSDKSNINTVSIGIADNNQISERHDLFEIADQALYMAKKNGKNQVEIYKPDFNQTEDNVVDFRKN